ncbi:lytic transglycosylase domain-containing protein [Sphingobium sp. B12D2B]|uniref:lytic transglycosylase domain-containing protein n=1 Tax=Sphingobium sp. B12D2B TaxID=2940577 RepID=UPI002224807B|nr:lytic transglycosylase domain-containing protein [Sphingobium sp. B12D2B]MCW2351796.1 soluble lytic murein transglycosylase-like protein [Sphingobium sp. B12D2B]
MISTFEITGMERLMTSKMVASAALLTVALGSAAEGTAHQSRERRAEVIVLSERAFPKSADERDAGNKSGSHAPRASSDAAPVIAALRTHDLSRRWVAFEMASGLNSTDVGRAGERMSQPASLSQRNSISPAPMIAIPRWMTNGEAFVRAPTSFSPSCTTAAYRPSGFLDPQTENRRLSFYEMMSSIACTYGIPVGLFDAMIIRESGYRSGVYSRKNAYGLTQLMPGTAADLGVNRYDVEQNLHGGARYLRQQLDRFGAAHLALAAYNAGPSRVKNGLVPRMLETQAYVENILTNWHRLASSTQHAIVQKGEAPVINQLQPTGRAAVVSSY